MTAATNNTNTAIRANDATNRHGRASAGHPRLLSLAATSTK
jgi:hypothetical protein